VFVSDSSNGEIWSRRLKTGDELKVFGTFDNNLYFVELPTGATGWLHKWDVCSRRELKRRRNSKTIPDAVVRISHENNENALTYNESRVILETGMPDSREANAFWLDGSTEGIDFVIYRSKVKVKGKPGTFYFRLPNGELSELTTWDKELLTDAQHRQSSGRNR
jgi:hypothetical protein